MIASLIAEALGVCAMEIPANLKSGDVARLFPVIAETGKEQRASSILLSVLSAVPAFANSVLGQLGQRIGARTKVDTFTEIVFKSETDENQKDRPDGLILIGVGKRTWSCLVEAKIGNSGLEVDQIERYLRLARDNNVDAVLTISNAFSAVPTHHPLNIQKSLVRKVNLFHLSWSAILTDAILLHEQASIADPEQAFLLREFVRFFSHSSAGIAGFTSMPKEWSAAVDCLQAGGQVAKTDGETIVDAWHQEVRDLALIMSRIISCRVGIKISRQHLAAPEKRIADDLKQLCDKGVLSVELEVPNAASSILTVADLNTRSLRISMIVDAPKDKVRNASRVNWLLRQLKDINEDEIYISAIWSSRLAKTVLPLREIRENPGRLEQGVVNSEIRSFEITLTSNSTRRFAGIRTFIEEVEYLAPKFYELIGQHLQTWRPTPPKPKHSISPDDSTDGTVDSALPATSKENQPLPSAGNAHTDLLEIPPFLQKTSP